MDRNPKKETIKGLFTKYGVENFNDEKDKYKMPSFLKMLEKFGVIRS